MDSIISLDFNHRIYWIHFFMISFLNVLIHTSIPDPLDPPSRFPFPFSPALSLSLALSEQAFNQTLKFKRFVSTICSSEWDSVNPSLLNPIPLPRSVIVPRSLYANDGFALPWTAPVSLHYMHYPLTPIDHSIANLILFFHRFASATCANRAFPWVDLSLVKTRVSCRPAAQEGPEGQLVREGSNCETISPRSRTKKWWNNAKIKVCGVLP